MKRKKTTRVADVKLYAVVRAKQDEEYQELHEAIEYMNGRHGKLLAMMELKAKIDERSSGGSSVEDFPGGSGSWMRGSQLRKLICWKRSLR